ncbi:MAG TPA: sigma-70 family RNA polymerase sigma factor [Acetobacteraceae bacterium]|jgi:RNA polymerase sigma factor (sigma-70 family)|nr:sigma-70 family RNA polymerase sigma factor [Acetobacteraceae bacterium]
MTGPVGLMEACIPALRRYAATLLRDRQEVDDLVHDCLVRALDQIHTRRAGADMRAWLFAIMHNLFVDRLRQRKRRGAPLPAEELGNAAPSTRAGQEEHVHAADIISAMQLLPEEQRSVLLLVSVEDLSYAEVAQVLGIPIGTVMSRLARARERLREITDGQAAPSLRRVK